MASWPWGWLLSLLPPELCMLTSRRAVMLSGLGLMVLRSWADLSAGSGPPAPPPVMVRTLRGTTAGHDYSGPTVCSSNWLLPRSNMVKVAIATLLQEKCSSRICELLQTADVD